ncbi:MAG: type II toxin-antitoxin system TacA family antitoxin [Desulfuromonadaceae bacterium]
MSTLTISKTERIDVRANVTVKQLLQDAARACHKSVSEFLLDAGVTAANQTLADRQRFELDSAQWLEFQHALDRPVQSNPRMKALLTEPGILD